MTAAAAVFLVLVTIRHRPRRDGMGDDVSSRCAAEIRRSTAQYVPLRDSLAARGLLNAALTADLDPRREISHPRQSASRWWC
jgi:hypothetical protein